MLTKNYKCSIMYYNYIVDNYAYTNYGIYKKMLKENKDMSWAYNILFIEKYTKNI